MKKIIAFITSVLMLISLVSCSQNEGENGNTDLLDGKTPKEIYSNAIEELKTVANYEAEMKSKMEITYLSADNVKESSTLFRVGDNSFYRRYEESGEVQEQWYTDEAVYVKFPENSEKIDMNYAEYVEKAGRPSLEGLLPDVGDGGFDGASFKKDGELYLLDLQVTAEEYESYTGAEAAENIVYEVRFDGNGRFVSYLLTAEYKISGIYDVRSELSARVSDVGKVEEITAPDGAENYRTAPKIEELDFSTVESLDGIVESEVPTDYILIDVRDYGKILVRLFQEVAPDSVEQIKKLVDEKFYDGVKFHRVIKNFMIQCGGYKEGGALSESKYTIYGEFASNGFTNNLTHKKGVVSMARANDYDSASAQFFIMHKDNASLDGLYAAFGFTVYGLDVVDAIATVETDGNDKPKTDVVINSIRFVTLPNG